MNEAPPYYQQTLDSPAVAARISVGRWAWAALRRYVPAVESLRHYSLGTFSHDLLAGLTVAAVAVPQAMAYALVAGLDPQYGLYTAIVMTVVGAVLTSSKQLINGPTNAISIALLSALVVVPEEQRLQAAILMSLLVGVLQTTITLLRLGDLTRFISHAVIVGFTAGAGVLLVLDQIKNLLGLVAHVSADDPFLKRFWLTLSHSDGVHPLTAAVGLGTIALVLFLRWVNVRLRRHILPELLLGVISMTFLVWACGLDQKGVPVVSHIPRALPAFAPPDVHWGRVQQLSGSALAIAVLGLLEAIAMSKALAARSGEKLDINQQCLSEGLANIAGSFFHCFPGSGSLTRSAINQQAGGMTQWSGVISAVAVAATVLLFAPLASYIPKAALAGILVVSAWRMVDRRQLLYHLRATRYDAVIVLVTAISAVAISVEFCILIGVFLSFILFVPRVTRVRINELIITPQGMVRERVPNDPPCGRILIFNLEGELFFGSGPALEEAFANIERRAHEDLRVLVLRVKHARNPDGVCLDLLEGFIKRLEGRGIIVLLCGVRPGMAKGLRSTGLATHLGYRRIFHETTAAWSSTLDAIRYAYELIGTDYCSICPRRQEPSETPLTYMI
jgi:SulP family sulfate permease